MLEDVAAQCSHSRTRIFEGDSLPLYTVLSHRWEQDEVTFTEVVEGSHENRKGWAKILSCCKRSIADGYQYIWADTCCIYKKSSAELSEAINSMFRWYQNSSVCYAYLSDVSLADYSTDSVWFTRGWTLQELLAPTTLLFFDQNWTCIGSKTELSREVSKSTAIPERCITQFSPGTEDFRDFGVAQIMSWTARRQTTRIEDRAYSLMGLFYINMPLLYGEGRKAFLRLENEVMKTSNDLSLFAWHGTPDPLFAMLATSPDAFTHCQDFAPVYHNYTATKHGLTVESPFYYKIFNCLAMRVVFYGTPDLGGRRTSGCILLMDYDETSRVGKYFRIAKDGKYMVFVKSGPASISSYSRPEIVIKRISIQAIDTPPET